jgi:hypothetical protein
MPFKQILYTVLFVVLVAILFILAALRHFDKLSVRKLSVRKLSVRKLSARGLSLSKPAQRERKQYWF